MPCYDLYASFGGITITMNAVLATNRFEALQMLVEQAKKEFMLDDDSTVSGFVAGISRPYYPNVTIQ